MTLAMPIMPTVEPLGPSAEETTTLDQPVVRWDRNVSTITNGTPSAFPFKMTAVVAHEHGSNVAESDILAKHVAWPEIHALWKMNGTRSAGLRLD